MNNFPIKFADDLICYNVIGKKDTPKNKQIGYFTIAKNALQASMAMIDLISKDTDKDNPFKLWNTYNRIDPPEAKKIKDITDSIEFLMKLTESHQKKCLIELKKVMKKPLKKLIGDDDVALWTYLHCSKRQYFLFDPDGAAIEERNYLNDVITKYKDYKKFKGSLYFQEFIVTF